MSSLRMSFHCLQFHSQRISPYLKMLHVPAETEAGMPENWTEVPLSFPTQTDPKKEEGGALKHCPISSPHQRPAGQPSPGCKGNGGEGQILQTILKPNSRSAMLPLQPSGNLSWLTATLPPLLCLSWGGHLRQAQFALPSFQKAASPHSSAASGLSPDPASYDMCGEGAFPVPPVRGGQSQFSKASSPKKEKNPYGLELPLGQSFPGNFQLQGMLENRKSF